jgi:hypothetical protein
MKNVLGFTKILLKYFGSCYLPTLNVSFLIFYFNIFSPKEQENFFSVLKGMTVKYIEEESSENAKI